jgi:receptor protein-tyrosine kinase
VAREFAETLASSGLNVLLIDADLRTSGLTASLGVEGPDVTELVQTGVSLPATSWGKGRLTVVPSRGMPVDQERFLRGAAFASWLDAHRSRYDYILLDAPPLLRFADGTLISRLCDGMIIVVRAEATKREALTRAREQLARAEANIVGVVLNGVRNPVPPFLRPYLTVE